MNILLGQKEPGSHEAGIHGLEMLSIPNPSITIVSGCDPLNSECETTANSSRQCSKTFLKAAEVLAGNFGVVSTSLVSSAPWVDSILQHSKVFQPDLIILSDDLSLNLRPSTEEIVQVVDGAKCSVLIARTLASHPESTTAVFATDHSPFCLRCIRSLLRLLPTGITNIRIISALDDTAESNPGSGAKVLVKSRPRLSERTLLELNRALVEHLESYGFQADAQLYMGSPQEAIDTITKKVNPDFLIICAQGAGFAPEKGIGELVRNQIINTTSSVLVLQP